LCRVCATSRASKVEKICEATEKVVVSTLAFTGLETGNLPTKFNHPLFQWTTIRPPSQRNRMQRSSHIKVLNTNITGTAIHHLPSFPLPTD